MLEKKQRVFLTIPPIFEKELEEEILEFYKLEAQDGIPLVENIVRHLTVFIFRFANYELYGKDEFDDNYFTNLNKESIREALANEAFTDSYFAFRKNVEFYLEKNGFFYETNWVYADKTEHYNYAFVNSPLQSVW